MEDIVTAKGYVDLTIRYDDGRIEHRHFKNQVLRSGRAALASCLTNNIGGSFQFYITSMAFGGGGTVGGTPRFVDDTIDGLFPPTIITKGVIAQINPDLPYQAIFTSVLNFDEAVGTVVNEMGLQMQTGDFYSIATFGDISKTSSMEMTWSWTVSFL